MAKKISRKKMIKKDSLANEKAYLTNVINHLDMCAKYNGDTELGAYFQSKADLNRQRLKELK